jgi:inner membrane protein
MKSTYLLPLKLITIFILFLLLLIPLEIVKELVRERKNYHYRVKEDIAKSWAEQQTVAAPIIVIPFEEVIQAEKHTYENGIKSTSMQTNTVQKHKYLLPQTLEVDGNVITKNLARAIYEVPVYSADLTLKTVFNTNDIKQALIDISSKENATLQRPYIIMGVSDPRGFDLVELQLNGDDITLLPGANKQTIVKSGTHAHLDIKQLQQARDINFVVNMKLRGMETLMFIPVGLDTKISLSSPWLHPSFMGDFLPTSRQITENGFKATWQISAFASNINNYYINKGSYRYNVPSAGVKMYQSIDIYHLSKRSLDYALLFILITFVTFFLFETLSALKIHFLQYALVGVALAVFYLLLLSLSEHLKFISSYIIATIASTGLISFYVAFVLKSYKRGAVFGGVLLALYSILYMILNSEDYALLSGALLAFGVMAIVMIITRNVDWYNITYKSIDDSSSMNINTKIKD